VIIAINKLLSQIYTKSIKLSRPVFRRKFQIRQKGKKRPYLEKMSKNGNRNQHYFSCFDKKMTKNFYQLPLPA